jgi:hypothetical protein
LQRPRTIGGEGKRSSPQAKGKGDYWRRKKSYPPISKERVIGGGRKREGAGMRDVFPHIQKERDQLEGKKNIISVGLVRIHLKIGN